MSLPNGTMLVKQLLNDGRVTCVTKFGRAVVTTSPTDIWSPAGNNPFPQVAETVKAVSDSVNDAAAGSGARQCHIFGVDDSWDAADEILTMDGTSDSAASVNKYFRLFRGHSENQGQYGNTTTGQAGTITVSQTTSGAVLAELPKPTGFAAGQTQMTHYTVPNGFTAYIVSQHRAIQAGKDVNLYLYIREGADVLTAPFQPVRLQSEFIGVSGASNIRTKFALGPYPARTDIWYAGVIAAQTADVTIEYEIALVPTSGSV